MSENSHHTNTAPNAAEKTDPVATHSHNIDVVDLSPEDEFYYTWGRESLKNNLVFANEVLRQLVGLMSLLLGGSVAFLNEDIIEPLFKIPVILAFFIALILAFLGMMPYEKKVALQVPAKIKAHKEKALLSKRRYLWGSGAFLAIGFGISLAGIIIKLLC